MPKIVKGIRNLPIIWYAPNHWWVLNIDGGLGTHNVRLKGMDTYEECKVLMLK